MTVGLPWATGILSCRQNKHWKSIIDTTRVFLQHFAADESAQELFKSGQSLAEISRKELASKLEDGWVKFPSYLFSESDEQRMGLLAAQRSLTAFDHYRTHGLNVIILKKTLKSS